MIIQSNRSGSKGIVGQEIQVSPKKAGNAGSEQIMGIPPGTDTTKDIELHVVNVAVDKNMVINESEPLTNLQECAIDLHKRGFNVFPIRYGCKEPFAQTPLKRMYNSRLHLCGDGTQPCRHGKKVPIFASLFTGRKNTAVMCGKTSGNLLDVDCDTPEAYELIGKEIEARGLPYWTFTSHRGGSYLLRILEGEAANVKEGNGNFENVGLYGNSHYVIVPMSVHPSGVLYNWRGDGGPRLNLATPYQTLPAVSVIALDWLGVTLLKNEQRQTKSFEMFGLSSKYEVLSKRNRETLAHGAIDGLRNTRLTALAYDMKGCNLDWEEVEEDFLHAASLCRPAYNKRKALDTLKCAYTKDREPARKAGKTKKPTMAIQRLISFANSYDWKGKFKRKARMRKRAFMECIERSKVEGQNFRGACRELGEKTNRKYQFMSLCIRDLCNAKLLRLVTPWYKSESGANVYTFGEEVVLLPSEEIKTPPIVYSSTTPCKSTVNDWRCEKNTNTDAWKDVFGKLGDVAEQVFCCLQAGKYKSKYAIAKATGAAWSSVSRVVDRLIAHKLAIHSQSERLYYAEPISDGELLMLSLKLETNGRAEMQRVKHSIDREIFVNHKLFKALKACGEITDEM